MKHDLYPVINKLMAAATGRGVLDYCRDVQPGLDELEKLGLDVRLEYHAGDWHVLLGKSNGVWNQFHMAKTTAQTGSLSAAICYAILNLKGVMPDDEEVDRLLSYEPEF